MALQYAIDNKRKTVTLVHKGNIMKFTEGAFRDWGYEVAKAEFREHIVTEDEVTAGASRDGKILVNDRIADSVFQQILTRTADYDVFATPNLNGDYLSDACAAQVGGLGMAPGREHRRRHRLLRGDPRHRAEVRGQGRHQSRLGHPVRRDDVPLPGLGRGRGPDRDAASRRRSREKKVTYDLARQMDGRDRAEDVGSSPTPIIGNM